MIGSHSWANQAKGSRHPVQNIHTRSLKTLQHLHHGHAQHELNPMPIQIQKQGNLFNNRVIQQSAHLLCCVKPGRATPDDADLQTIPQLPWRGTQASRTPVVKLSACWINASPNIQNNLREELSS